LIGELGCSYLDVLLIHWPGIAGCKPEDPKNAQVRLETYRALEELVDKKLIKGIGVSNFLKRHLEHLLANTKIKPVLNQIEIHPLGWDVPTV
jgi:methylglyoxal/glyoxal reductase